MHTAARSYASSPPKLLGGALCLDFINTTTWRGNPERMAERLHRYGELVHWSLGAQALDGACAEHLLRSAAERPEAAEASLSIGLALRAELEAAFDPARKEQTALPVTQSLVQDLLTIGRLTGGGHEASVWGLPASDADLRFPLLPMAISALDLAVSSRRHLVCRCADPDCGWVFLDETRNRSRRWCSMSDCGNRAKARAHYARSHAARS
ncbi:Conserved protein containing a Zn-ribbon-like motif, possibly RNA-binding [Aureimonas altamirensis DSM 21988]|uniref:Conserved protein containing a Zn-ribbon-like motif, possibly RNA-binding n=1 Tax=Aureimonas altamirensis DSM 21988 TaxID=1121026 RepID=A0ABY1IPL7_9HYPH|nr:MULTISPECIES: CGNR zinc finger domain-containing protein [Aureimonas]QOG06814.1 CGNR zinc finger domain-containing protein [Aureimonas sp. OT7]SHJ78857.1 Conserved protein containing a Zn-ribbon-like motif, possibly RNA-binding [Aureimonas altamirensis DSM 21988]